MSKHATITVSLSENPLEGAVARRAWNGVSVDVVEFRGQGPFLHKLRHSTQARLSVLLDEVGSPCEPRIRKDLPCPVDHMPRHLHYAPAGLEVWGYSANPRYVRDATLTFDQATIAESRVQPVDPSLLDVPRMRFFDERIWTLTKLLTDAMSDPDPSSQLYGDGLSAAIVAALFSRAPDLPADTRGLAPWQLRRVTEYVHAHLRERTELARLAKLAGMSQAHFSRAFKTSTGVAPYRWQLEQRVRRAQDLLLATSATLEEAAEITGFADAAHFGRTFRKVVGVSPAAWRRDRKS